MKNFDLFILSIAAEDTTSGVDRYIEILINALIKYSEIQIYEIKFLESNTLIRIQQSKISNNYTQVRIPFPIKPSEIIQHTYWLNLYNKEVLRHIGFLFENSHPKILHSNTLNLIDFALLVKKQYHNIKIVSHLHCIPWKGLYDCDLNRFNLDYNLVYINHTANNKEIAQKVYLPCEFSTYLESDKIICLSQSAIKHISLLITNQDKIVKIYNGIEDRMTKNNGHTFLKKNIFHCLFVGSLTPSKGIVYIIDALEKVVRKGYSVHLSVAGLDPLNIRNTILNKHKTLAIDFLGLIPYTNLKKYYQHCDCGIITSLHEQNSYAAIEMMMNGMPIITTNADGLDEMFSDGINAIKIPLCYNQKKGLFVNTNLIAKHIIELINSPDSLQSLSIHSRENFIKHFSAYDMAQKTVNLYNQIL